MGAWLGGGTVTAHLAADFLACGYGEEELRGAQKATSRGLASSGWNTLQATEASEGF